MARKNLMDKTTGAITGAVKAVADAITPKPIRAGDKLIIPSADASMPPVIVPVRKRARRKPAASARRTTKASKAGGRAKATRSRKSTRASARKTRRTTKAARR